MGPITGVPAAVKKADHQLKELLAAINALALLINNMFSNGRGSVSGPITICGLRKSIKSLGTADGVSVNSQMFSNSPDSFKSLTAALRKFSEELP